MKKISFITAFLIFVLLIIKLIFLDIVFIPSNSMLPTLFPGDFVIISKIKTANRSDLIVFKRKGSDELYIKRVIALGGDSIAYQADRVILNNKDLVQTETQITKPLPLDIRHRKFRAYRENRLSEANEDHQSYVILIDKNKVTRELKKIKVDKFSYFVLGDNRNHSSDSRDFGVVEYNQVVGTAIFWW